MDEKQLQFLFDQYGSKSGFSDFAEFKGLMADSSARKVFFDNSNKDLGFKDYGEFESLLGFKKKDGGPDLPSSPSLELPSVSTEPPKRLTYTDINSSIEKLSKAQKNLRDLETGGSVSPGGYNPTRANIDASVLASAKKTADQARAERDKIFSEYAGEISRPVEQLIESQDYTKFFTPSGNIDYGKAREHFQKVSQKFGGGPALVEHWIANLKMRGQGEIERKEVKPLFEQKLKELGLQKYADQEQYAKSVFDAVVQKNKSQVDLLIQDRDQRANGLLDQSKAKVDALTADFNQKVEGLNEVIKAGQIDEQSAKAQYDALRSDYEKNVAGINSGYQAEVSKINRQVKQKYGRINQELDAISKDKDFVMKSIPEADRKLIDKAYIDARAQRMKGKETVDRAVDEVSGLSGLFARSVSSGFLSGIASIGDAMSSGGYSNKLVDWMQNKRTAAEELKPAEYTWSGDPLKRAITSSGQSLGASAPLLAPSIGIMAATGGSTAGVVGSALLSYYGENKQNAGQVYRDVLEQSGDVALARDQANEYFQKTAITLPLYFLGALGDKMLVLGKGLKKAVAGFGLELAEEIPVEYIQSYREAVTSKGYKGTLAQYIKENPELMLDIAVGTGVQAGAMKTLSSAFSKVASVAPATQTQTLADAIMTQGREFATRLVQTQFDQGLINEQKRDELFQSIGTIEANLAKLDELGVRGDAAKLHMALSQEMAELQANRKAEKDESVQAVLDSKINDLKTQMTGVLTGQTEYIVFGMPGDVNSKTMLASTFNALSQQEKDDTIRSAKSVTVINNPQLNQQLQDQKQALGNPEGAPEGAYETDATVQSQVEQQAGPAEGGVQERPGVDGGQQEVGQGAGQQGQAPVTQPDTGDRVLGGQEEVALAEELRGELRQDFQPIIDRAAQSLQAANIQFEVLDDAEFTARVGQSAEGAFMTVGNDGKILLNRQKMEQADPGVIIWHESAHPVMNIVRNTNKPLYDRMVTGLKQLAQKSPELQRAIEFGRQYGTKLREAGRGDAEAIALEDDESIVESIAMIAADDKLMASLPTSIKQTLIDFVNYVAKALGIKARVTNTASADFRRTAQQIATALKEGRDITEIVGAENVGEIDNRLSEGITDIDGNPVDPAAAQFKVSGFKALINGIEFKYLKDSDRYNQLKADGFITEDKRISDFSNVPAILHVPDHAFTGEMIKDGEVIVDGKGGVFYPLRFHDLGYFWASTKTAATGMAAKLNAMRAQSPDGKMRLVLLSAPEDKLMSSTAASAGMLDVLLSKAFDRRAKITKDQVFEAYRLGVQKLKQEALTKGQKGVKFSGKVEDFVKTLPTVAKSATVDAFKSKLRSWFAPDVSNFDQRKKLNSFVLDSIAEIVSDKDAAAQILEFLAESSGQKIKSTGGRLSKANLVSGFSKLFSEPMLKGVATTGDAYAVIELDADVEAVSSNEHESYPFALKSVDSNKKPVVHILQDRTSWPEFTVDPETGSVVTEDRQDNILPPSAGISNVVTLRPTAKPSTQLSIGNRQAIIDKAKADGTYLKAPNGRPTNLSEDQWTTVRTPEFKNWFGDWENDPENASKVVDKNGEPMVVYHGSDNDFDTFKYGEFGFHFGGKKAAKERGKTVKPYFLSSKKQLFFDYDLGDWNDLEMWKEYSWVFEEPEYAGFSSALNTSSTIDEFKSKMLELYDGIKYFNAIEGSLDEYSFMVFSPNQIKSATSNVGTFSTEDARIQFSIGGRQPVGRINWERSPEGKGDPSISSRNPIVTKAAQDLKDGKITNEEYRATVSENSPIRPITRFFEPATEQEVRAALSEDKSGKTNAPITDGTVVGLRLDIPAYQNKNTWVVSVHDGDTNAGNALSYRNVGMIRNVRFGVSAKGALGIATGKAKQTIGRMFGEWVNIPGQTMEQQGENAKRMVQDIVDSPDYVQVGMNPFRHSYFYDRNTDIGRPIVSADEVIQVGGLVYAKNPVYGNWTDESYAVKGLFDAAGAQVQFSAGPRAESRVEFKLVAFVLRKKAEGYTDQQIAVAINSALPTMAPQDIARLIQNPQQYLVDSFPGFTAAQHSNLYERAKIANIFRSAPQRNIHPFFRSLRVDPDVVKQYYERTKTKREMANAWAKSLFNKNIRPSRGLENWMIQVKEFAKGAMNLEVANAKKTIDQLESTAKKIGFDNWDLFREAMSDAGMVAGTSQLALPSPIPASITRLPLEIQPYVTMMRDQIDGLTSRLIGLGYVTPEQAITLQNNVGQYVNRAYRLFSESGYQPDPKVRNAAIDFLTNQEYARLAQEFYDKNTTPATGQTSISGGPTVGGLANIPYAQLMEQAAKNAAVQVNRILNKKENPYFGDAKVESRSIGVLKQRQDIPVEIRRLMGEYTDPGVVFMMTVVKQSALLASSQYLKDLRTRGMGTVFFEANDPNIPPTHSVQMASEGSSVLEPLNGLYTTPEIAEALNYIEPTYNMAAQIWMKMVGMVRMGKTVLSPVTQIINFIGNFGFAVMNGLIFTKAGRPFGAAMGEAWRYARGQYKTKQDFNEVTKKAIKLGIVGQSVDANSISEAFSSGDLFDVALDVALTGNGIFKTVKKNRIRPVAFFENLYRMGDDFWKIYAYISEREAYSSAKYKKKYADLTPEEQDIVDAQASERVKNTWPTFSRIFPIVRTLNKTIPLLGDFTGFQGESIRTPINTVLLALEDLKDPDLQASGARRLAAITAYIGIQTAVTAAIPIMLGYGAKGLIGKLINDDDEEEKKWALDEACPPHMYHHDKAAVPSEKSPHILTVISMNANNPINWTQLAVNAYFDGTSDMSAGALAAVFEIGSRFLGLGMTTEAVFDVQYNTKSQNGKPIYIGGKASEGGDDDATKFMKGLDYAWNKLQPSAVKLYDRWSTTNNPGMEGAAAFGFRTYEIDLHKSFSVHLSRASKTLTDIDGELKAVTMFDKKATEEMKKEAIDEANEKKMAVVQNLNRLYRAYIKLGADPKVMRQTVAKKSAVKLTGMDDKTKAGILNGDIKPNFY